MKMKSDIHASNIDKRGNVKKSLSVMMWMTQKGEEKSQVGPIMLGIFLFVVIGSALFQILNVTNQSSDTILSWCLT
jgi:hypothetical protein